jgi:tetratricopeptide (TPR) repeat protein
MAWQVQWALAERDLFVGNAEQALARFTRFGGIKRYQDTNSAVAPFLLRVYAALNAAVGRLHDAHNLIQMAIQGSTAAEDRLHLVEAYRVYGQIKATQGQFDEANDLLIQARVLGTQTSYPFGEARALEGLGLVSVGQGNVSDARGHLTEARNIFARLGATKNCQRADEALRELGKTASLQHNSWMESLERL